jgi:hypothetical protein
LFLVTATVKGVLFRSFLSQEIKISFFYFERALVGVMTQPVDPDHFFSLQTSKNGKWHGRTRRHCMNVHWSATKKKGLLS